MYCNHLTNCPGCLLKLWTLRAGAYLWLAAYWNLVILRKICWTFIVQHFLKVGSLFCNKTINNNWSQRCTKAEVIKGFALETLRKTPAFHRLPDNEFRDCRGKKWWTLLSILLFQLLFRVWEGVCVYSRLGGSILFLV